MASERDAEQCPIEATAQSYYDSEDAEAFYSRIWGGENIHIGLYNKDDESIADASHRTVEELARLIAPLTEASTVLDMGSGYGGTARHIARTFGCSVTCLNLSSVENERARQLNEAHGLNDKVSILDGTFEAVGLPDATFDAIYSQDAFLHSGNRGKVVQEAARLLKPGGLFVFTDIMQADDCDEALLQPILQRIHLSSLGSPSFYRQAAQEHGLEETGFLDHTHNLVAHYSRVREETVKHEQELLAEISQAYIDHMKTGLQHWVAGGKGGRLRWGFLSFRKPQLDGSG